jgi:hypothetical protein
LDILLASFHKLEEFKLVRSCTFNDVYTTCSNVYTTCSNDILTYVLKNSDHFKSLHTLYLPGVPAELTCSIASDR